ncbi:electron transfer flavoprotein subunit beta/FixA family protein [Streptomyces sp. NPDC047000]|uniref:electron transfer flavoprotein subunit beta/FixA family protein n=1 Tax=Streptomyces sp. NPDC047000 TaxID=3155474 RepID=UPI0033FE485E
MSRTVVCVKWVADEGELRTDPVTLAVDAGHARRKICDYDRNTVEAARVAAAEQGGELIGLTFGGPDSAGALKDVLSRGADRALHVLADGTARADGHVTAHALAAGIRRFDDVGLVLCTEGASDTYAHETGPRIAELLGWPVVTNVGGLTVDGRRLRATRVLERETETVECDLPAVVTVVPEIGPAPVPGLRSVIAAGRKPTEQLPLADLGLPPAATTARTSVTSLLGRTDRRRHVLVADGDAHRKVAALLTALAEEGVLR